MIFNFMLDSIKDDKNGKILRCLRLRSRFGNRTASFAISTQDGRFLEWRRRVFSEAPEALSLTVRLSSYDAYSFFIYLISNKIKIKINFFLKNFQK